MPRFHSFLLSPVTLEQGRRGEFSDYNTRAINAQIPQFLVEAGYIGAGKQGWV